MPGRADPELVRRTRIVVEAHERQRTSIVGAVLALIARLWRQLDPYDPASVEEYTAAVARAVAAAQQREADTAAAALRKVLELQDLPVPGRAVELPAQPRGVDPLVVAERPVREYRRIRLSGLDEMEALERAERRALVTADSDITLGMREGYRQGLLSAAEAWSEVVGYRRVIHPELSTGGTCGLCIAASDRIYKLGTLLPVHGRCRCTVEAVVAGRPDPGQLLNREDLAQLYAAAGSTAAGDLARVRYQVDQHGELGPVLTREGQHFRDEDEAARDTAPGERPVEPVAAT